VTEFPEETLATGVEAIVADGRVFVGTLSAIGVTADRKGLVAGGGADRRCIAPTMWLDRARVMG
jgi:hypothetical protein